MAVNYRDGYFLIDGHPFFFYSGEIHYSRIPKELWENRLQKLKGAFFNSVGVYSFWNWHEPEKGKLDLTDLKEFIQLSKKIGLKYFLRPGSYCCAEWEMGGYPSWVIPENVNLRSLTKKHMQLERHWHGNLIKLLQEENFFYPNGPVIMYQIENEYFWKWDHYLAALYKLVHDLGVPVPIVTNENPWCAKTTPILNGIDLYPGPWDLLQPTLWMIIYQNQPKDRPKFSAELEGGWFSTYGNGLPTLRGSFPAEWTSYLARSLIALGLNGINFYMFDGGTNFGYWAGGGNARVTTTYDYETAIREWGELHERYFLLKLLGAFLDTAGSSLVQAKPKNNQFIALLGCLLRKVGPLNTLLGIKRYLRKNGNLQFWFLSNQTNKTRDIKLKQKFELNTVETRVKVNSKSIKIVPLNFEKDGVKIQYITSHLFHIDDQERRRLLICHEDEGAITELSLKIEGTPEIEGTDTYHYDNGSLLLLLTHEPGQLITIKTPKPILIFPITTQMAKRLWYIDGIPMLSDIYFAYSDGKNINCELDSSKAHLTFLYPQEIHLSHENEEIGSYNAEAGMTEANLSNLMPESPQIELKSIHCIDDCAEIETSFDDSTWRKVLKIRPLEDLGIFERGFTWYRATFTPTTDRVILEVGARDYVQVFLNGKCLGTKWWSRSIDITKFIKKGESNSLVILIENTGHRHHNPFERSGLIHPPILHNGTKSYLPVRFSFVRQWDEKYIPRRTFYPFILPIQAINKRLPTDLEDITISESIGLIAGYLFPKLQGHLFYKASFKEKTLPNSNELWLLIDKLGQNGYFWLNNQLIKRFINNVGPNGLNLTKLIKVGAKNTLLFALNIRQWNTFLNGVSIVLGQSINNWRIQNQLTGQLCSYFRPDQDLENWSSIELPHTQNAPITWYKLKFDINLPEDCECPLRFTVPDLQGIAIIYFNGSFIGRYEAVGPQHDFFIPPSLIQNGAENDVTIVIHAHQLNREIPVGFTITPYLIHKTLKLPYSL